jgi:hypothetical protein
LHFTADVDLGLAVIERWTHAFLAGYEKSNDTATLNDVMVAPFADKNVLSANIGIKEDTSVRKFNDVPLRDFFGVKGGLASANSAPTIISSQQEQHPPPAAANSDARLLMDLPTVSSIMDATTSNLWEKDSEVAGMERRVHIPAGNSGFLLLAGFLVALFLATTAEKAMMHKS